MKYIILHYFWSELIFIEMRIFRKFRNIYQKIYLTNFFLLLLPYKLVFIDIIMNSIW